jgi:aerotaxis receptor
VGNRKNISILETDMQGNIIYINSQYSTLTGYSKSDLIGSYQNIFEEPYLSGKTSANILKKIDQNRTWVGTLKNRTKNNKEYWTNTTVYPFEDADIQKIIFVSTLATKKDIDFAKKVGHE